KGKRMFNESDAETFNLFEKITLGKILTNLIFVPFVYLFISSKKYLIESNCSPESFASIITLKSQLTFLILAYSDNY
ncbi:MAG: hypothetical protein WCJ61_11870, partial [Paludibacter sp.]